MTYSFDNNGNSFESDSFEFEHPRFLSRLTEDDFDTNDYINGFINHERCSFYYQFIQIFCRYLKARKITVRDEDVFNFFIDSTLEIAKDGQIDNFIRTEENNDLLQRFFTDMIIIGFYLNDSMLDAYANILALKLSDILIPNIRGLGLESIGIKEVDIVKAICFRLLNAGLVVRKTVNKYTKLIIPEVAEKVEWRIDDEDDLRLFGGSFNDFINTLDLDSLDDES